jgi:uncharacterized Zn ribbon protein
LAKELLHFPNVRSPVGTHPLPLPEEKYIPMRVHRLCLDIIMVGTAIACALALLIATLGAVGGAAVDAFGQLQTTQSATEETYEGMVTCSRCGARHSAKIGQAAADCTRMCVHGGANFALVDGDKIYLLEGDLNLLKRVAGQRVKVAGVVNGNTIRVTSAVAAGS